MQEDRWPFSLLLLGHQGWGEELGSPRGGEIGYVSWLQPLKDPYYIGQRQSFPRATSWSSVPLASSVSPMPSHRPRALGPLHSGCFLCQDHCPSHLPKGTLAPFTDSVTSSMTLSPRSPDWFTPVAISSPWHLSSQHQPRGSVHSSGQVFEDHLSCCLFESPGVW